MPLPAATLPNLQDVHAAAAVLHGIAVNTPLLCCAKLSGLIEADVRVKAECLQRYGSFKYRGAYHKIATLPSEVRARGVLAFSSGNHGGAVAGAARAFGIPAVVVMPADAPRVKLEGVRERGAELVLYDRVHEDREAIGKRIADERRLTIVKPFDDATVIVGQGTIGLEIAAEFEPDIVLVPASGGGLATGIALAMPRSKVYAVEPKEHADIAASLRAGSPQTNPSGVRSICDALLAPRMGDLPYALAKQHLAGALSVSDAAVKRAMCFAFRYLRLVLEPGGAIALAAALEGAIELRGSRTAIVASGGNVDPEFYAGVLAGS